MLPLPVQDLDDILERTQPLWERIRGKRMFLTGCTGFFGAWLLESLDHVNRALGLNLSATVLSREPSRFLQRMPHLAAWPDLRFLEGDIRNFAFPTEEFDYVVHAAAATSAQAAQRPLELLGTLIDGTRHLLSFAQARGAARLLFISSGAVYGKQPESLIRIPEDYLGGPHWLNPGAAYAEGKRVAEQICTYHTASSAIELRIARCFAFVGPHLPLDQHFAIGNFIADAVAGRDLTLRGDGTPMRSYLYAADLSVWLWTLLLADIPGDPNPGVFNVGSSQEISIRDLAQTVIEEVNPSLRMHIARKPVPGEPPIRYVPDVSRAQSMMGLQQTVGLREAIHRTVDWLRSN